MATSSRARSGRIRRAARSTPKRQRRRCATSARSRSTSSASAMARPPTRRTRSSSCTTRVPGRSVAGFEVGQKIAIGYGATYPAVAKAIEKYEVGTVAEVGKPGTQAYLGADAPAGATNIKVTSVANISAGDKIRLDIDSLGHGIETVTVAKVGTQANRTALAADASGGATTISVRNVSGFAVG